MPPSGIRKFFDVASQMEGVISLGVGEPDYSTPWTIREAAIWAIERGITNYTSNHGMLELRYAIAHHLETKYGVAYRAEDECLITVGVSEGLDLALRAILNPHRGEEVLIPEPCYVSYKPCTELAGGVAVPVHTSAENGFHITAEDLRKRITPRTRAILLNYPNNPTGASLTRPELEGIAHLAEEFDLIVLSDEIYGRLSYEIDHTCFSSLPGMRERTILFNGFSKAYAMTGWRIAYACGPEPLISAMVKIHQYTMLCAPIMAQYAAYEALQHGEAESDLMVESYSQRRRLIVNGFRRLGLSCHMPEGAFYTFPSIRHTGMTSIEFCERLLYEEKVAVVPGNAFGACGEGHFRASYAASLEAIEEALERMERFLDRIGALKHDVEAVA
ncbi:MAG: aminotransferase class I/II-fold pyridoxal phosphate-dependent enzyme [Armatimonadetes bacterium]|nr:aminotransferase class I/II-fold pyridoxal phosphate-dependent enzyme [Armatimonadota bacterium]